MTEPWTSPSAEEPDAPAAGEPSAAPPPPAPPEYGPPQYGPPQYGTPPAAPYSGAPQYGAPQYGTPQYGAPAWGAPAPATGRNRGPLVVAGIVVGVLLLGILGLSVVGFVLLSQGSSPQADRPATRPGGPSFSLPALPPVAPTLVDPVDLRTGDCFLSDSLSEQTEEVSVVPCTQAHDTEMSGTVTLPETPWPGADKVDELSDDACLPLFESYVGIPFDESDLDYSYITPRQETWESGDRMVICLVMTTEGTVATPMANSRA